VFEGLPRSVSEACRAQRILARSDRPIDGRVDRLDFGSRYERSINHRRAGYMGMAQEFKDFAMRGNVVDMAVGIIIGGAFGKIVSSFVGDVLMPPIGMALGGVDFSSFAVTLQEATADTEAVTLSYGVFINTVLDFLIVAFAIFMVIKLMNAAKKKEEEAPAAPPAPSKEEVLLTEIRDVLRSR
jgi:large conductance mechanosensitive channel